MSDSLLASHLVWVGCVYTRKIHGTRALGMAHSVFAHVCLCTCIDGEIYFLAYVASQSSEESACPRKHGSTCP